MQSAIKSNLEERQQKQAGLLSSEKMHIVTLGTGSPMPNETRDNSGIAIVAGGEFVLVVNDKQMVEQRYITTGDTYGTAAIVKDGLREGESVIVEGLQRVRPGVAVDAVVASEQPGE